MKQIFAYTKNIILYFLTHLMLLPIIELFCCAFDFLVLTIYIMFTAPLLNYSSLSISYIITVSGNFYNVWGASNSPVPFLLFRLFYFAVQMILYNESFFFFFYFFFYLFCYSMFIEYYSIILFKRTPTMFLTREIIVDIDGYDLSKRQIFNRTLIKYVFIFSTPIVYPILKHKKVIVNLFDYFGSDEFIWNTKTETNVIPLSEYKYMIKQEKLNNLVTIQKGYDKQNKSFIKQYEHLIPNETTQIKNYNQNLLIPEKTYNSDLTNCNDIDEFIINTKIKQQNDFINQYSSLLDKDNVYLEKTNLIENDVNSLVKLNNKKKAEKTGREILNEQFSKQYADYLDK